MTGATLREATPIGLLAARLTQTTLSAKTRALLSRGDSPRTGQPVWRNSYTAGTFEHQIWKPISDGTTRGGKRWTAALLKAARSHEYRTRLERRKLTPGSRNGALGEIGLEVLAFMYDTVDYASGRLEPAIGTIADGIGRSYNAVHEALCRLRNEGFLHWMRRTRPIDDPEPGGQWVEQIQNAYALLVPDAVKGWLSGLFRKAPVPDSAATQREIERKAFDEMLTRMSLAESHEATWKGDRLLGETLRRMAAAIEARDSQKGESSTCEETGVRIRKDENESGETIAR